MGFFDFYIKGLQSTDEWKLWEEGRPSGTETQAEISAMRAQLEKRVLVETLGEQIERLTLVCNAIWELVRDSNNFSDQNLLEKVKEIDLRDGTADGKIRHTVKPCPKCGKIISMKTMRCMYCGTSVPFDTPSDLV